MLPRPIRVLVVDDAVVIRKIVTDLLKEDPAIEVVGTAANGHIALQKITQVNPDILTHDVEMPDLDGLETLRELRKTHPKLPVIMFSTLTERGAGATLEALALGASDYVTKPANIGKVTEALQRIREQLIPKIKGLCGAGPTVPTPRPAKSAVRPSPSPASSPVRLAAAKTAGLPEVLAVGVSTGGPNALASIIPLFPADLPVPVVLVQHMPPMFTRLLADRLNQQSKVKVCEAAGGEVLEPGVVYIAPGDYHLTVRRHGARVVTALNQDPPENSCRPAVDVLFRSVAEAYGSATFGVVLTGMGQDGLRGAEDIRRAGGCIFAQDEESSVVWGMPGFVAKAGLAERIVPLPSMAAEILRRLSRPAATARPAAPALTLTRP